jgi:outer membrane beta-barrel protein
MVRLTREKPTSVGVLTFVCVTLLVVGMEKIASGEDELSSSEPIAGGAGPSEGPEHGDACIDENIQADLFAKRKQRTSRDRLFQQTNRHELSLQGGYYASDLFDGVYSGHLGDIPYLSHVPGVRSTPIPGTLGVAYTYHMTEDLGVEASAAITSLTSYGGPELERTFAVLQGRPRRELYFDADLLWVPAHAKLRLGGSITHFDLYLAGGAGVVDSVVSEDLAGNGGFGFKFFLGHAWAIRIDVRDHIYRQQLLAQTLLVNDLTTTVGLSLYLPIRE